MTKFLSTLEAALALGCSSDNVRRLAREGRLRAAISTRAGRLFTRRDVETLSRERQQLAKRRQAVRVRATG